MCPADTGAALTDAIQTTAIRGMKALGLVNGPGHCELPLSADGTPYILEIAARIGGSGCAHFNVEAGVVAQISQQVMTSPALGDCYTWGFLTGRPSVFSLFIALTYAITSPTWPL